MVTAGDIVRAAREEAKKTGQSELAIIQRESEKAVSAETKKKTSSVGGGSSSNVSNTVFDTSDPFGLNVPSNQKTTPSTSNLPSGAIPGVNFTPNTMTETQTTPEMGQITSISHQFKDDEIIVKVTYKNTSSIMREIRAYLYTSSGDRVDKEPDLSWINVAPGNSRTITLSSAWKNYDINDFGGAYRVTILAEGGIFIDERVVYLDSGAVVTPGDRNEGTTTNPDTAPVTPSATTGTTTNTPAYTGSEGGFFSNLFGGSSNAQDYILIALLIGGAYLLGRKK